MVESRVARALVTVKEMLEDRGIGLGELANVGDKEAAALASRLDFFHLAAEDRDVVFVSRKLKNPDLLKAAEALDPARRNKTILILTDKPQSFNLRSVATNFGPHAEVFTFTELQFNVSRHHLVPKHAKMTDVEVKQLLASYQHTDKKCLPSILATDPMAKYLGLRHGDVVRITRPSQSAGVTTFHRHCV